MLIEVDIDILISKLESRIKELGLKSNAVFNYQFNNYGYKKGYKKPGLFSRGVFLEDETWEDFNSRFWTSLKFQDAKHQIRTFFKLVDIYRKDLVFLNSIKNQFEQKTVLVNREEIEGLTTVAQ